MDIRKHTRFTVHFQSSFSSGQRLEGEGTVLNLSVGGCKVQSDTRVSLGTDVRLRIMMPDEEQPLEIKRAAVRWTSGQEFGLEFTFVEAEGELRLRHFVQAFDRSSTT